MRKYFAAILLLPMSASLALSIQKPDEWIKYTSPEGRYSVSLPAQPNLSTQEATAADGQKFPQYLASVVEPGDVAFMIGYFDSVPGTIFSADAARDGMVKRVNGTLISETAISLGGYPGRELKVLTTPAPAQPAEGEKPAEAIEYIVRARFYEAGKRVYVLQFIFPKSLEGDALAAKATKYFDSFQVVKN
jgi:hypothetical protein